MLLLSACVSTVSAHTCTGTPACCSRRWLHALLGAPWYTIMQLRTGRTLDPTSILHFSDLPQIAIEDMLRRARGRSIAGTNKFAKVCRQWRDAGGVSESLQLLMDLSHLSEKDLARATNWLSMHGQHVDTLVIEGDSDSSDDEEDAAGSEGHEDAAGAGPLGWFVSAAPAFSQLRRLEVSQWDILEQLVPAAAAPGSGCELGACGVLGSPKLSGEPCMVGTACWLRPTCHVHGVQSPP
jgi:hypothetical protein